jgi:hypothetical protein
LRRNGDIIEFVEKEKDVNVLILDLNFELIIFLNDYYIKHKKPLNSSYTPIHI